MKPRREVLALSWLVGGIWIGLFCLGIVASTGCQQASTSEGDPAPKAAAAPAANIKGDIAAKKGSNPGTSKEPAETLPASDPSDRDVLQAMVAAYKNAKSYRDEAKVLIQGTEKGKKAEQSYEYSVAFVRPNKVRASANLGTIVCDGKNFHAFSQAQELANQIAKRPAPAQLTIKDLYSDEILMDALIKGPTMDFSWVPIQVLLLTYDDPLKTILHNSKEPELLEPAKIGQDECVRVQLTRPDGRAVLWIDRRSHVLRRLELPTEEVNQQAKQEDAAIDSMVVEFQNARFDGTMEEEAFKFEAPANVQASEFLKMPALLHLGKPAPELSFTGPDGKKIDPKSLEGKVVVIDLWAKDDCPPCRISLPMLERVYQKYKNNDKVVFLAVSVDKPDVAQKDLEALFKELNVTLPIARDPQNDAWNKLEIKGIPSQCILGPNGVIQDIQLGFRGDLEADLTKKIQSLLDGKDISGEPMKMLAEERTRYLTWLDKWVEKGLFLAPTVEDPEPPPVQIAPASQPKAFTLTPLWKCPEVKAPANVLVLTASNAAPKLLVIDNLKSVVEVGADGKVLATHPLDIAEQELVTFLRTATDRSGKRYYAASGAGQQRVHLFDENWKLLKHYPENALEQGKDHRGISDVQLDDLDGDGTPELVVSYLGEVGARNEASGVDLVSLDGKRLWNNPTVAGVSRVAIVGPDPQGKRAVLCTNMLGSLAIIDHQGKSLDQITVPNRAINWIAVQDLTGDQQAKLCGLYQSEPYALVAVGIDLTGKELWSYPLPKGILERPVEQIVAGHLSGDGPGQWLLSGADGSIHVVGADGKPVDRFNYGATLAGLATLTVDGKPVLVVASKDRLEALRVDWAGKK